MSKKILVWLSWWVDSAVSALLLKEAGYEVACGFMINYLDEENPDSCPTRVDLDEARRVADFLELPFYTFDYREEYEKRIVEYIYREYESGRTPNPDVFCNNLVKFDLFLEEALALGFDGIATGHYARREATNEKWKMKNENYETNRELEAWNHQFALLKWVDPTKDQSYFLSRLSDLQLSKALFPIGHLLKSEVREIAQKAWLPNADRKDSQGLCFIGKVSMKEFLERRIPKKPWNIINTHGKVIWQHEGAFSYTIGQRKWIWVWWGPALFVIDKNIKYNTVTVGNESDLKLFSSECTLIDCIWEIINTDTLYTAKIRYRQEDQQVNIQNESGKILVKFNNPQRAIASGQVCVIYEGDRVILSGIII